jgi:hypothetical protein
VKEVPSPEASEHNFLPPFESNVWRLSTLKRRNEKSDRSNQKGRSSLQVTHWRSVKALEYGFKMGIDAEVNVKKAILVSNKCAGTDRYRIIQLGLSR